MSQRQIQKDIQLSQQFTIEACPQDLLKTVENLKKMNLTTVIIELSFKTIDQTQTFARILNRQEEEQKVANELKMTFFHNVRGKIKKMELLKNQSFVSMKKIGFNSVYHATLFLKFYPDRLKQIENEYKYHIISGKDGFIHVYINDQTISSMFVNQIRDMKKRLQFLQIKDYLLCQKFIYSQGLCKQLQKINIFHQVWYKGKQSTIIFYSEKQPLVKMKSLIHLMSKYHMSILKMADYRFSFLINYLLFKLIKQAFSVQFKTLQTVDPNQIEFNENKLSFVIHDMHQIFAQQIVSEILGKMKNLTLINIKAKNSRKLYNSLKKDFSCHSFLFFSYSKKNVCICINKNKLEIVNDLRKVFDLFGQCVDQQSQIIFSWFHLQHSSLQKERQDIVRNYSTILSTSKFHIQNFEKFIQGKDPKCILRLKNANQQKKELNEYTSKILFNLVISQNQELNLINNPIQTTQRNNEHSQFQDNDIQIYHQERDINNNSDSQNDSQYCDQQGFISETYQQVKQNGLLEVKMRVNELKDTINLKFLSELINENMNEKKKFTPIQNGDQVFWKEGKSMKRISQFLEQQAKLISRVKSVLLDNSLQNKLTMSCDQNTQVIFCPFNHFNKHLKFDSSLQNCKYSIYDLEVQKKYIVIQKTTDESLYPLCTIDVFSKQM